MAKDEALDGAQPQIEFPVAGVGASAGGLEALTALLRGLPDDPGLALVVILHLVPDRASHIAEILGRSTKLPVGEVTDGVRIEPNRVYVIPPNTEMTTDGLALRLRPRRARGRSPKPVDVFLMSLALHHGRRAIGVVLSGADGDGKEGLQAIKRAGGVTFAQDETAKVSGMPESSIATGAVDFVLPPAAIARELARLAGQLLPAEELEPPVAAVDEELLAEGELEQILHLLREATGVDLCEYKRGTVRRRILRRIGLHRIRSAAEYIELLRGDREELKSLHTDILIHVTRFFRDAEAYRALQTLVIPGLVSRAQRSGRAAIRVWVPGCATGEEAYSLAICLLEGLAAAAERVPLQIFGTDLSEAAIERARAGLYAEDAIEDVGAERLRRFFVAAPGGFQVSKLLRDVCVFARHDVARDPPFSHLDLISCRNVLIYMSGALQNRVIPLFHYGLDPGGYLFLGSAESIGRFSSLFAPLEKHWNLYVKLEAASRPSLPPALTERSAAPAGLAALRGAVRSDQDLQKEAVLALLPAFAPPGVVVNEQLEVLQVLGRTGSYLELPPGKASFHLLSMARAGLSAGLFHAVRASLESGAPAHMQAHLESENRPVQIRVVPLGADPAARPRYRLVVFEEPVQPGLLAAAPGARPSEQELGAEQDQDALMRSRQELEALRLHLQSVVEGYDAAHEELQVANEEVLSSNEELQSTNEELQTTKEEVEATNEELSTINDELQARVAELARLNDDWVNVLSTVQIPLLLLDRELRIRNFTPAAAPLFNLIVSDLGRPLQQINIAVRVPELSGLLERVLETLEGEVLDVQDFAGRWYSLRVRPYRTQQSKIDGLILVLLDIDETKRAGEELQRAVVQIEAGRDYAEAIVATVRRPLIVLDEGLRVRSANPEFYRTFVVSERESEGRLIYELGNGQWDIPELRRILEEIIPRDRHLEGFEVDHDFPTIGRRTMRINARRVEGKSDSPQQILLALDDVTERRRSERALEERDRQLVAADERKNEFLAMLAHELRNPLAPIVHAATLLRSPQGRQAFPAEQAAEMILRQAERLVRLVDDLLDVSRLMRGKVELRKEVIDLRAVLDNSLETAQPLIGSQRHELRVSLPPGPLAVYADPVRLEQIFGNLLNNAAKYTDPGGLIELSAEQEAGWAVVRVRDSGIGISAEMLPQVFELFAQENTALDRRSGGLGIGLSVVRSLAVMHGGTVEARSDGKERGSEFSVRLPCLGGAGAAACAQGDVERPAASNALRPPARCKILIVEDNRDAAAAFGALLQLWDQDVATVGDGFTALEAVRAQRPDLMFIDLGLPGMTGYELARKLRAELGPDHPRLVAMTGYGHEEAVEQARAAGFAKHLVKPVDLVQLHELIEQCAPR